MHISPIEKLFLKFVQNLQYILSIYSPNYFKNSKSEFIFYDPNISQMNTILTKYCPYFLDFYAIVYGN